MRVAPKTCVSVIYNTFICPHMPHMHMLQSTEILQSVTNGP